MVLTEVTHRHHFATRDAGDEVAHARHETMIPRIAHFIWYGESFPWVNVLALRSAILRGGFERVVLHHASPLPRNESTRALFALSSFESRVIDLDAIFMPLGWQGRQLAALHERLRRPSARANVLRAAILAHEGGVYLDMDTVTVRSLVPLLDAPAFCGEEHVAFPGSLFETGPLGSVGWVGSMAGFPRAIALHCARAACRRLENGARAFKRLARHYPTAANNAVLGAAPGSPLMLALLERMTALPRGKQQARFVLGTHLLQRALRGSAAAGAVVHPPEVFYPLGPEISHAWFQRPTEVRLDEVLSPQTRVVHWYASVESQKLTARIDPEHVRAHRHEQLFSALAHPFL